MSIEKIKEDFSYLEEWEDRYRYVIDLGKELPQIPDEHRCNENKVQGCVSQVWLITSISSDPIPILTFVGDSDAHIVRGLIAILRRLYSGKSAQEILDIDARSIFHELGLDEHLSPQRSNGLFSMIERIRKDATKALEGAD